MGRVRDALWSPFEPRHQGLGGGGREWWHGLGLGCWSGLIPAGGPAPLARGASTTPSCPWTGASPPLGPPAQDLAPGKLGSAGKALFKARSCPGPDSGLSAPGEEKPHLARHGGTNPPGEDRPTLLASIPATLLGRSRRAGGSRLARPPSQALDASRLESRLKEESRLMRSTGIAWKLRHT